MTAVSAHDVAHWRESIGQVQTETQYLDPTVLRRFLLVLGENGGDEADLVPEMAHWAYFLPMTANEDVGPDGHLRRGGFLPPVTLPRRMFAAGATRFVRPLFAGLEASCITRIVDVAHKSGRSGDLVFVEVERSLMQSAETCLIETQTIVYRHAGPAIPPVERSDPAALETPVWTPGPVDLFRFSAVTFNAHRIHYDQPYAVAEEGYPGLVVHGPLTASMLCRLALRTAERRRMTGFQFRAVAPLFVSQPIRLRALLSGNGVEATARRQDGAIAVIAKATFE